MTTLKHLSFFLLFFWAVSSATSCKSYAGETKTNDSTATLLNRQDVQDSLPGPIGYVNDFESLFTESEKQRLDSLIQAFEKRTSIQIAVITIDTTMTTRDSLEAFTLGIAKSWGVGQKDKNNGVTIGISKVYRKINIQNGYGIEKILSNAETKEIIDKAFIPGFREGDYFQGTFNGIKALMKILEERYR